ncbi:Zip-domain-containing protein [Coemansia reversa NRRL 1564]|uniref:Zip-domain-containing protein n=1 Tax=Coemansia reversa (strain ATCC 12441 / NRRL 1564) TaxID=763665 RepID=A0A2G5BKP7_COERN|nr:Zip-domain-containing protein [Coemansia reversa NRRL 1564]|eukprot:PIA19586.1 Zip-domain-containing protein [Coemansia reversa NRRL 1564]
MKAGLTIYRRFSCHLVRGMLMLCLLCLLTPAITATTTPGDVSHSEDLFGQCPLFDTVVRDRMLSGKITVEEAFAELDSQNCPIIHGASITSPQQLQTAVEHSLRIEAAQLVAAGHQKHPDNANCQRLGELTKMVLDKSGPLKMVMDELVTINCPALTSCEQFGPIKDQYSNGGLNPSKAIAQLVEQCSHFSPSAKAPQQVVRNVVEEGLGAPPGQSMADECRRLSDMLYTINDDQRSTGDQQKAKRIMEILCDNKVPIINNCPLFQSVKARYKGGEVAANEAIAEMKNSCPILSKELNPAMIFNFEEYGKYRDTHYDLGHKNHGHGDSAKRSGTADASGCGCGCGREIGRGQTKKLFKRHEEHDDSDVCLPDGKSECNYEHNFAQHSETKVSGLERLLGDVFPKGNPALSSLLATFYISLFPNLILFATPSSIPNKVLRVMVGFAVGGLLGDVFLHLLPHMFAGEHGHGHGHSHSHGHEHGETSGDHVRNTVYGCTIFLGLMVFFSVDKFMRLLGAGGHSHSHHNHSHAHAHVKTTKQSGSSSASDNESKHRPRKRRTPKAKRLARDANEADDEKETGDMLESLSRADAKKPIKLSAYLNLIADATHNFTDGLAMSASFYLSHAAGLSTFVAVFFHEIPHELGDFAILVQSGFSRTSALASQFFTALGAITGTIVGILIEESSKGNSFNFSGLYTTGVPVFAPTILEGNDRSTLALFFGGILGMLPSSVAGVPWSKLVIPFTAGGFIYVGTVSVLPDLLQPDEEEDSDGEFPKGRAALRHSTKQKAQRGITMAFVELGAMLVGLGIMAAIALSEE